MEKKNVPKIRFPGVTERWEQRKLGEISDKVTEKNINNTYNETFTNSAEYGIIPQRDFFEKDISNIKNLNGYYVVRNDDFVYNPRISNFAPVGPIKRNKLLKTGVMSPLYYVFRTRDIDRTYLEHYFDTTYWHMFMKLNGDSGARSDRFAIKDSVFVEMPIPFPKLEEQKKIGMFFEEFDNLITLHQRKLENLKKQKKGLLQKMFPEKGKKVPEIRFPEFTNDWEQRKLESVIEDYVEKSTVENQYPVLTSSQQMGIVLQDDYFSGDRVSQSGNIGYFIIPKGYFAYRSRSDNNVFVFNRNDCVDKGIISYFYPVFKPKGVDSDFLLRRLNYGLETQLRIASEGTGQHVLSLKKFKSMIALFPKFKEQEQIGTFFRNLDNLISLHQRKLEHLQKQKKALLQQMFV